MIPTTTHLILELDQMAKNAKYQELSKFPFKSYGKLESTAKARYSKSKGARSMLVVGAP